MTDWSTALVSGITATAALGGVFLQSHFTSRNQLRLDKRADRNRVIDTIEQIFAEIEDLEWQAQCESVHQMEIATARAEAKTPEKAINLGHIRASAGLYFPELAEDLANFDQRIKTATDRFSGAAHDAPDDASRIRASGAVLAIARLTAYQLLFAALRQKLQAIASTTGAEVRASRG